MAANDVTEPAVQALIAAINAGDRQGFFAALTPDATMSDDGTDRDLASWARSNDIADAVLAVVSCRYASGSTLIVDGGLGLVM